MDRDKIFVRIYVARFLTRLQSLTPHVIASTSKAFFYRNRTKMSLKSSYQVPRIFSKYTNSYSLLYLQTHCQCYSYVIVRLTNI